jgi:AraC family transcriptional regulator, regulatory protein of adaptative response / methylated-DNA-[protein]-cysteine methyltransferase
MTPNMTRNMTTNTAPGGRTARLFRNDDQRWEAVRRRDRRADGAFYSAVRTTGIYCRPSCSSRLPRRGNVEFYATPAQAEAAGYRACKRCKPKGQGLVERQAEVVAQACRMIEQAEELPRLDDLARSAGLSPFHFHRVFKAVTGVTPKAFADAHRGGRVRDELKRADTVTEAIYGAGFNSNARFYESSAKLLGMTPSAYRAGGAGATIRFAVGECSLGPILVAATDKGVCAIQFGDDPDALVRNLQDAFPKARLVGGDAAFEQLVAKVVGFVEAPQRGFGLPLHVRGTAFQQKVWRALRKIAPGKTASYTEIAAKIGEPNAVRAVAQACGANPAAVAIPCHRVVRRDGELSGYRWGVERKRALLQKEAAA